ncbi:MAG: cobalamin-binding protein [Gemmatimonadota bacterium]|nr:MAG: cobalamin-binding protein [Gemmatimonadota bacterium]
MRLVSLACSNTEIVAALGRAELLVGVDDHSDYPAEVVEPLPRVGPDLEVDIEKVVALDPDLVLASLTVPGHELVVDGLREAGVPFIAPSPESLTDVYEDVLRIGGLLDVRGKAATLVGDMRWALEGGPLIDEPPSVLVQWWPKPVIAPCAKSWVTDLLSAVGARNILENDDCKSRPLTDEEVRKLGPDAIVISWCGVAPEKYRPDVVLENAAWRDLDVVREQRVYCVPEAYLGRPGPRLVDGARALRKIVAGLRDPQTRAPGSEWC